jgi:protein gp37
MGSKTGISWTDATWNPVTGCTPVSPACDHCYAERYSKRGLGDFKINFGDFAVSRKFSDVRTHPERLDIPLHWRKPKKIFVCSMGDLFHESVPDKFIDKVFAVMAACPEHTFQVLTKRAERMKKYLSYGARQEMIGIEAEMLTGLDRFVTVFPFNRWAFPLPNVWLGVTAENQSTFMARWPYLRDCPAAIKFISYEPALGSLILPNSFLSLGKRAWLICGGESGPGARPSHPDWFRSLRDQCQASGIPFHFKQWGEWLHSSQVADCKADLDPDDINHCQKKIWSAEPNDVSYRVGKKNSGRLLDGKEWNEFPRAA